MKTLKLTAIGLGLIAMGCTEKEVYEVQLSDGWKVQSAAVADTDASGSTDVSGWYDASVPSTVMAVLYDNGAIPADILDGTNYKDFDRTPFDQPWWYQTSFELPSLADDKHVSLDIDGISYRADVWVNGNKVASADTLAGTFRRHSVDITPYVGKNNTVAFKVYRAQPGEPNIGFVDWNPRPADESMGIFRPVTVRVTGDVDIKAPAVKSKINKETLGEAWLTLEATLVNRSDKEVTGTLRASFDGRDISKEITLAPRESRTVTLTADDVAALHVENPRLWWCNNLGEAEMYEMNLAFDIKGKTSDKESVNFGIREIESYFTPEGHRGFRLNGKPVLVRSAGWTDDIFLRNDSARNELEVQYVRDMNLNSIRFENIWGTSEDIYDMCDKYGMLAFTGWSCHWEWENYLGSPCDIYGGIKAEADMDLIARSLGDQVEWLRNHPSIAGWFVGSDMLPRPELEERYVKVLEKLDDRPVITAAKAKTSTISGPSGTKMAGPYEYVAPGYWYDPKAPGGAFGWNTETGIGANIPQRESVRRMVGDDNVWPVNEVWDYHCTTSASDMNKADTLTSVINRRLGGAKDFNDYVRKAEWLNYDGTRTMFEAFRARIPQATGIVQWMLNSAWPSMYWQLYDHYLVPTSAYYSLRNSNAPLQLIYDYDSKAVVAVNESAEAAELKARMTRYAAGTGTPVTEEATVNIEPYTVVKVFDVPTPADLDFVFLTLADKNDAEVARNFYVLPHDSDVHAWDKTNWVSTPVARHADFSALSKLPVIELETSVERDGDLVKVSLHNPGNEVSFFNRLAAKDAEGKLIAPARWSDNYISLAPGETRTVECRLPADATITIDGWNITEKTL